ncbi:hypothetical protein CVT24_010083 [Panaeolus cyanescens]|uniref:F-box domain-containing protein n=1 Tax=Panaeolus cyanescens TaxID=181874 RepID=A0A409YQ21_9AGAR|nr:hypothetical protein CVT24_010083 [Panaeolus cyanescens]
MSQLLPSPNVTGIDHLPDEILSAIFDNSEVPLEDLFQLRLVSRRLHYFALPLYLARFKIKEPTTLAHIVLKDRPIGTLDALDGLQAALYVRSLETVTFTFDLNNTPNDTQIAMRHMRRVHHFLDSLTAVRSVVLIFGDTICGCCSGLAEGETLDDGLLEWSSTAGRMLNKILEKSCQTLRIRGGRYLSHAFLFRFGKHDKPMSGRFTALRNLFRNRGSSQDDLESPEDWINVLRGDTWTFERAKNTGTALVLTPMTVLARAQSSIRSLHIQSMMLSVPPLLHWTIATIQLSSMTTLKLSKLSINRKCWPALFSLIADANSELSEIHLERIRQITPSDLLRFLGRFPKLSTLHLARDVESIDSYDLGPFPDFPCLISLAAPASWVLKLLSSQRMGLGRLESLTIFYKLRNEGLSNWLRRTPGPSIPTLLKEQKRPLTVSLDVCLGNNPGWRMLEDIDTPESARRTDIGDVSSLTLIFDEKLIKDDIPVTSVLPRWIGLFFDLRHLAINTKPNTINPEELTKVKNSVKEGGGLAAIWNFEVDGMEIELEKEPPLLNVDSNDVKS